MCIVPHSTVLYCTVLYCTVLYCTVLYCSVLYCTVLYCTVLYCTVLYECCINIESHHHCLSWHNNVKNNNCMQFKERFIFVLFPFLSHYLVLSSFIFCLFSSRRSFRRVVEDFKNIIIEKMSSYFSQFFFHLSIFFCTF